MLPIPFPESNFTYTKPEGWTDEQCSDLHVWTGPVPIDGAGNKVNTIISKWQPSKEDIEAINNGGAIYLSITGNGMPPVCVFTENPFIEQ